MSRVQEEKSVFKVKEKNQSGSSGDTQDDDMVSSPDFHRSQTIRSDSPDVTEKKSRRGKTSLNGHTQTVSKKFKLKTK